MGALKLESPDRDDRNDELLNIGVSLSPRWGLAVAGHGVRTISAIESHRGILSITLCFFLADSATVVFLFVRAGVRKRKDAPALTINRLSIDRIPKGVVLDVVRLCVSHVGVQIFGRLFRWGGRLRIGLSVNVCRLIGGR
jgi:hypothetical protein